MKNKIKALVIAPFVAFALTGCITVQQPEAQPETTETTQEVVETTQTPEPTTPAPEPSTEIPATPESDEDADELFVALMRDTLDPQFLEGLSDAEIVEFGKNICLALDNSGVEAVIDTLMEEVYTEWDAEQIGLSLGLSVGYYCPEYEQPIQDYFDQQTAT